MWQQTRKIGSDEQKKNIVSSANQLGKKPTVWQSGMSKKPWLAVYV